MDELKDKKEYELAFVVKNDSAAGEIKDLILRSGAEITQEPNTSRIRLAYEIKKEREAIFGFMQFVLDPDAVKSISDSLNLRQDILRFLIVTPPPMKEKRRTEMPPREIRPQRTLEPKTTPLSNQELEKKIEEILQ